MNMRRAAVVLSLPFRYLRASAGLLEVLSGGRDTELVALRRSYAVRWRRYRVSKSWHCWDVLPSYPSGISTLSLPHSQVRFRISSARSSSRFRLLSGWQCSAIRSRYRLVNQA